MNIKKILCLTAFLLLFAGNVVAQTTSSLKKRIEEIATSKNAVVGVAIASHDGKTNVTVNGKRRFPMQSVFKFHIGLKMLSEIDKGKFSFDQKIEIKKSELLPGLYSPIRNKYPEGTTLTITEILEYTVSSSDNVGCDIEVLDGEHLPGLAHARLYFINHQHDVVFLGHRR
mgnify:CR=1 FL=1